MVVEGKKAPSKGRRFLLWCSRVCGCSGERRAARALRKARRSCVRLQQRGARDAESAGRVPLEHLRAAEHHLAALEQWLQGTAKTGFDDLSWLTAELGTAGPGHEEDVELFMETFATDDSEILVKAFPCLAKRGSMNYPGKLYMSSSRLCFHASVFGAVVSMSCPWADLASVRLMTQTSAKMYPVQITFGRPLDFAGSEVKLLRLCLFDLEGLGHFDKCASFFTGSGLFGLWSQEPSGVLETRASASPSFSAASFTGAKSSPLHHRKSALMTSASFVKAKLEDEGTVWELMRRTTIWSDNWHPPFLPHDGSKKSRWMVLSDAGYAPHPALPSNTRGGGPAPPGPDGAPPIEELKFLGQQRLCTWTPVIDDQCDKNGWQYAVDFYSERETWSAQPASFSHVRRRRWQPVFAGSDTETHSMNRLKSTLLADRGLGGVQQEVLECDIGQLPLARLAEAFEAEDWTTGLMSMYYSEIGASDMDIHDWTVLDGVKGKTRSVECRMLVPPAPMCPKETRCNSTWHVSVSDSKVVMESVTMSLDVPYGTTFNVVVCDTFSQDAATGATRMTRSCAVDWVSSIWLKSLVEENVPPQTKDMGERWAGVLRTWAAKGAP